MTLLLASVQPRFILITADGRSTHWNNGKIVSVDDSYQKIFPLPEHPVALAQHGENDLDGKSMREFVKAFVERLNTGNMSILQIADELREYAYDPVRERLEALPATWQYGCGFWVGGFSTHDNGPRIIELFWKRDGEALRLEERHWTAVSVLAAGDGAGQADKVDWHNIANKELDQVRAYHAHLLKQAMSAKTAHNSVGGHVQELVITPDQWQWTARPKDVAPPGP